MEKRERLFTFLQRREERGGALKRAISKMALTAVVAGAGATGGGAPGGREGDDDDTCRLWLEGGNARVADGVAS